MILFLKNFPNFHLFTFKFCSGIEITLKFIVTKFYKYPTRVLDHNVKTAIFSQFVNILRYSKKVSIVISSNHVINQFWKLWTVSNDRQIRKSIYCGV